MQTEMDFTIHTKENSKSNEEILKNGKGHFTDQCRTVYEAMLRGEILTTKTALLKYDIGDLRRRVKDLRDHNKIQVQSKLISGRFKEYFL